ncbi:MAG: hypothetical protein M1833_002509 [Piccolia ochrophora]|nr:MAG: hypothetical protein M1833_002509 [Piccolia ochrophora]
MPPKLQIEILKEPQQLAYNEYNSSNDSDAALKGVKVLYLQQQYKTCTARCKQLLDEIEHSLHPVHTAYLHFYAATCVEITARSQHPLSVNKIPLLHTAREYYVRASSTLPPPLPTSPVTPTTPTLSSPTSPTSIASTPPSSPAFSSGSESSLKPAPLRIRKTVRFASHSQSQAACQRQEKSASATTDNLSAFLFTRSLSRYNAQLTAFRALVEAHISTTDAIIAQTSTDQAARRVRFADLRENKDPHIKAMERKLRIERLRQEGWRRERFQAERYEALAKSALEGLE